MWRSSNFAWLLLFASGVAHAVVPTAPTNLTATAASTTQVDLSWTDTSNNETSFKIERKTLSGSFAQIATVGSNVTSFSDTGLTLATTYVYRVRAANSSGNSSYSNQASATTQGADTTAPSTPGGFNATPTSTSQINLIWNASTDAVGVTGYRVERCQGSGCTSFAEIGTPTTTNFNDTGLSATTTYRYRVRAADAAGNLSAYSSVASATTSSIAPVGAWGLNDVGGITEADYSGNNNRGTVNEALPTVAGKFGNALVFNGANVSVDLGNPAVLKLTGSMTISAWINSAAFPVDDAAIVSKFDGVAPAGFQLDTTVDTGPRTVGFKLIGPNGAYMLRYGATVLQLNQWYHVAGVYDAQAQTMTVYLDGVLDNGTLNGTVAGRQVSSTRDVFVGRRADDSVDYNFNGMIDEVRIYDRALSQAEIQADMNAAIAPPAPDTTAPSAPSGLMVLAPSTSQINLAWTTSTDAFDVTGYRIERCQGAGCADFAEIATAGGLSFNDTGLTPGAGYSYRVRAADGAGNLSGYSGVVSVTTLAAPPSGGPVGAYPFEEGSGTTTADFSGSNNTGTLIGATWTAGRIGNALAFDGVGANVDLGNPPALQFSGSMTVSAWINSAAFPRDDAAIVSSVQFGAPQGGFQFDTTVDTGPRTVGFKLFSPSGALMIRYGATVLQLNQWYHVAGVYDAQAQTMTVYLNGVADNGTLLGRVGNMQLPASLDMFIGRRSDVPGDYYFNGVIDEVRIYNRALTQAEIQADMASPAGPAGTQPVSLTPNPLSVTVGASGTLTATLSPTPNAAGTLNVTSANPAVATVPASVSFATGQTSVPIPVSAIGAGVAQITASLNGASVSASVQVILPVPAISGETPKAVTLRGGSTPEIGASYVGGGSDIDVASVRLQLDGQDVTSQSTVTPTGVLYLVTQPLADALHTVTVSVANLAGGVAADTWTFTVDDPAPNFHDETPRDVFVVSTTPRIRVLLSGFGIGASSIRISLDGSDVTALADVGVDHIIFTPVVPLAVGVHTVNVSATDARSTSGSKQWQFTVQQPPGPATTDDGVRTDRTVVPEIRVLP